MAKYWGEDDSVLFFEKSAGTMPQQQVGGTVRAMPIDQMLADEVNSARPRADDLTARQMECFAEPFVATLATKGVKCSQTSVRVSFTQRSLCYTPLGGIVVPGWCLVLPC